MGFQAAIKARVGFRPSQEPGQGAGFSRGEITRGVFPQSADESGDSRSNDTHGGGDRLTQGVGGAARGGGTRKRPAVSSSEAVPPANESGSCARPRRATAYSSHRSAGGL